MPGPLLRLGLHRAGAALLLNLSVGHRLDGVALPKLKGIEDDL